MKKTLSVIFILVVLFFATVGGELLKPYISYFTKSLIDNEDPFNFKNEYELLIFQNEQKETKAALIDILNRTDLGFEINDNEIFSQCVIDKNRETLSELNNNSKLNPINPKTVNELDNELKKYQSLLIKVQTKSIQNCSSTKNYDLREDLLLSCECYDVSTNAPWLMEFDYSCGDSLIPKQKGVTIDFYYKHLIYGDSTYELIENDEFYIGVDRLAWWFVESKKTIYYADQAEDLQKSLMAPAITIERLTGQLVHKIYSGFYHPETGKNYGWTGKSLIPAQIISRQCKQTKRL
tara:strand:+ start:454 stop:1332 length:879 start_codon:yes stop_codon:yes gene_type:complete